MTTEKQAAANQGNALKSTGPKTEAGKAVVSLNALKHGLLSQRLFLSGEDPTEFEALQDELRLTLKPYGVLELALVEKIAVALWKQRRLIAAECAELELTLSPRKLLSGVKTAMNYPEPELTEPDLMPVDTEDLEQSAWCNTVLAEFEALDDAVLDNNDLEGLAREAPLMAGQFAQDHEGEMSAQEYLALLDKGLAGWAYELVDWCEKELERFGRRGLVQTVAELVRAERSAPTSRVLLSRYQVALDGELYRAMEALRKQQEWRLKTLGAVEEAQAVED